MITLHRKTNGGAPVRIVIDGSTINAYREEPAQIVQHEFHDGKETISVEPTLSKYFTEEPVMRIHRYSSGDFNVDFDAGFQRGTITVGQQSLTTHCHWPNYGAGYLKWIGLSYADPEVRKFLRGEDQ
ncbi:MAG: hypothetical protein E6K18_08065 [Methanobacteriota archaeon]|nr:MAG: hypothetical protein E6K18_08065 [Euryarchaeota archaeon]